MSNRQVHKVSVKQWCDIACRRDVVRRSARVAIVVGTILVLINYADRLIAGELVAADYLKMTLTYMVPYCVSTFASVSTWLKGG